ncbi:MAG TPA: 30S ribosomal protein S6 [bacterium]|nr:30S ribosomal protein S6 [bacterium]
MSNLLKYDVIYILDPNSTTEEMAAVATKIEQIINDSKGSVLKKDDWGKRRLAYMVKKHREGHYVFYHASVSPDTVAEITRNLRLLEKVIKFSIVKDTISHLKPKPRPVRTPRPATEVGHRPGAPRTSAPRPAESSAPAAPVSPAPSAPASETNP